MAGELVVSTINGAGFDGANVIYNPEFTINQRGAASRTAATGYNFDRWYYDGTRLLQGVEGNNLRAGTYVLSWSGSSTAEFSLNTAAASGQGSESYTAVTNGGTITIASVGSNNLWVRFSSDLTNLTRVKLSPGTEASGFVARPYGTELQLAMRYFIKEASSQQYNAMLLGTSNTREYYMVVHMPVPMRASPTVTTTETDLHKPNIRFDAISSKGVGVGGLRSFNVSYIAATSDPGSYVAQPRDFTYSASAEL
jgi:hypothetical protein